MIAGESIERKYAMLCTEMGAPTSRRSANELGFNLTPNRLRAGEDRLGGSYTAADFTPDGWSWAMSGILPCRESDWGTVE